MKDNDKNSKKLYKNKKTNDIIKAKDKQKRREKIKNYGKYSIIRRINNQ